ncbi:para-aminobenzoate synthase [Lindgomyces ingoldianus]|uniref:Para-aminobenzoate synthase n=1 Tax=Lindgomyces ingoldianus TaxID=673940 RepID=A0ACB6QW87_9PLEO|nr:para-aminobenzoate synthase [Lindgomyces ingoldianus]KAF2471269.1 para-aminobenzoate synthase [Lindgomyces ingoldianus]
MAVSGVVFAITSNYIALLIAAILGVISPSGNEIGPFRAVEESTLAHLVPQSGRPDVFAWYVVLAALGTSTGLAVGGIAVERFQAIEGWTDVDAYRKIFWIYIAVGCLKAIMTILLSGRCEPARTQTEEQRVPRMQSHEREPLLNGHESPPHSSTTSVQTPKRGNHFTKISKPSRRVLLKLCSLFFFDSLGSGMVPFSLVNLYMERKFHLPKSKLGAIMSATWLISTIGNIFASSLAKRIGLIQAMVVTHLPSSIFLALLPVPRTLSLTICLLVARACLNSMDQAPRSAFLSVVVLPEERTAVMGIVNILKTLSQSGGPAITGLLAGQDHFWVAFVCAGSMKAAYDLGLLACFAGKAREEEHSTGGSEAAWSDRVIGTVSSDSDTEPSDREGEVNTSNDAESDSVQLSVGSEESEAGRNAFLPSKPSSQSVSFAFPGSFGVEVPSSEDLHRHFVLFSPIKPLFHFFFILVRVTNEPKITLQLLFCATISCAPYSSSISVSSNSRQELHVLVMAPAFKSRSGRILYLDAYDSFSNNIVALVEQCIDVKVVTIRIDDPRFTKAPIEFVDYLKNFDAVIAGPGPGSATNEGDVGIMQELWRLDDADLLPVLGICLGFQSLATAFSAKVHRLSEPRHGIISEVLHKRQSIFRGVDQILATQYHSLQVNIEHSIQTKRAVRYPAELWKATRKCPKLEPLAWDFDSKLNGAVLMATRHSEKPFWGVQFHPESICTNSEGIRIVQNWWVEAQTWIQERFTTPTPRKASLLDSPNPPMTMQHFSTLLGMQDLGELEGSVKGYKRGKSNSVILSNSLVDPATIAHLIAYGDSKSLPNLSPGVVHCSTTGSGQLQVSDVCELLGIVQNEAIVLESCLQSNLLPLKVSTGRYSIIGLVIPGETLRLHYYVATRTLELRDGNDKVYIQTIVDDVWTYIETIIYFLKPKYQPKGPTFAPFWGGLMGYVSYEAGLETVDVEPCLPSSKDPRIPDICFAYITRSVVFDHKVKKLYIQSIRGRDDDVWVQKTLEQLYQAVRQKSQCPTPSPTPAPDTFDADAMLNNYLQSCEAVTTPRSEYCEAVASCQDSIANGDSYELCLTSQNMIHARKPSTCQNTNDNNELSWKLYKRLAKQNPAPFGAYMRIHNVHILSSSPERFISWDRNGCSQCRPIKGTVRKHPSITITDAKAILSSSKERAENLMIVDLVRHQLHGVYGPGNVRVSQLMEIEEYETLWQLVSVIDAAPPGVEKAKTPDEWEEPQDYVSGTNAESRTATYGFDAFVQSLPPGSMTGAPKKRSCELLKEIEKGRRRGIYSGVLGYLDVGGAGDFSVVIRTAVKVDQEGQEGEDTWRIGAGGAITSQSTADEEFIEMEGKFLSTASAFRDTFIRRYGGVRKDGSDRPLPPLAQSPVILDY